MGIDTESARFLLSAKKRGVNFTRCATLGRQHYFPSNSETRQLFEQFGLGSSIKAGFPGDSAEVQYSEPFWHSLGAQDLQTIDASSFEGATMVHDLNQPVPDSLRERFDVVCDVGTLEHVFDFPRAMRNCMEMVAQGGRFFAHTTANNYLGHGFYQFSPELFFRVLSPENGYVVERMVAVEYGPCRRWFDVSDPESVRDRVKLINTYPVLLFVQARREKIVPLFGSTPQQSDYVSIWTGHEGEKTDEVRTMTRDGGSLIRSAKSFLLERTPKLARFLEAFKMSQWTHEYAFKNQKSFKPCDKNS